MAVAPLARDPVPTPVPARIVRVACGCGRCGIMFDRPVRSGQGRVYAENCPVREHMLREMNRASAKKARGPRRCHCGCGRILPPRLWYHPECREAAIATRERDGARKAPPKPGKRCGCCQDQSWRRHPEFGCMRCGRPYAAEVIRRREPSLGCAIAQVGMI